MTSSAEASALGTLPFLHVIADRSAGRRTAREAMQDAVLNLRKLQALLLHSGINTDSMRGELERCAMELDGWSADDPTGSCEAVALRVRIELQKLTLPG